MAYETLLYEVDDRVATITLNRPERHNALSQKLCAELMEVVRAADQDPSVRVLVITGAGGKAFSAGYDIKESAEAPKRTLSEWRDRLNRDLRFTYSVWECSKPVIAMIDGFCLAGALEFAQMCDMRICSDCLNSPRPWMGAESTRNASWKVSRARDISRAAVVTLSQ